MTREIKTPKYRGKCFLEKDKCIKETCTVCGNGWSKPRGVGVNNVKTNNMTLKEKVVYN